MAPSLRTVYVEGAMKKMVKNVLLVLSLLLMAVILVHCAPATATVAPTLQVATASDTAISSNTAASPTQIETPTFTASPAAVDTFTSTPESASPTETFCPVGTAEPLWVEPVTSPTDKLSQTIVVRIGYGEEVTVITESGTFTATGNFDAYANPALVEITLLPNTIHNLQVSARVRTITTGGCPYGGYTLTTTTDRQGAALTIVQQASVP